MFVLGVVAALHQVIWTAFQHNPWLNGVILAILLFGIFFNMRRILRLRPEARWIEAFRTNAPGFSLQDAPRLLAPIAAVLGERQRRGRTALSALSLRHLLDSISSRLDENRDIAGYLRNLLIFLGLLGTFWGLIQAIGAIGGVIAGLTIGSGDFVAVFNEFKAGLLQPLSGMGTAFSASLFGLAGSLVLGFLDLQASQAEQHFYNELEEWLSGITRLAVPDGALPRARGGGPALPAYLSALLQQTADNLDRLQQVVGRGEDERGALQGAIDQLNQNLASLGDRLGARAGPARAHGRQPAGAGPASGPARRGGRARPGDPRPHPQHRRPARPADRGDGARPRRAEPRAAQRDQAGRAHDRDRRRRAAGGRGLGGSGAAPAARAGTRSTSGRASSTRSRR